MHRLESEFALAFPRRSDGGEEFVAALLCTTASVTEFRRLRPSLELGSLSFLAQPMPEFRRLRPSLELGSLSFLAQPMPEFRRLRPSLELGLARFAFGPRNPRHSPPG
jgi:hypothetical protein